MTIEYGKEAYWDNRYAKESGAFDWLFSWDDVCYLIDQLLPNKDVQVLMIGCGNAPFSPDMYEKGGYHDIVNTDISKVVIKQQRETFPEQRWVVCDVTSMPEFKDDSFHAIIDKSLIDTLMCCKDSMEVTRRMIDEIYRVMKPGSRLVTFSLHSLEETVIHYDPKYEGKRPPYSSVPQYDWKVSAFRVRSSRWKENPDDCKKAIAHTMIVCDKPLDDGTYLCSYPLHLDGVLSTEEHDKLDAHARDVQVRFAVENTPVKSLTHILDRALELSCPASTRILDQWLSSDINATSRSESVSSSASESISENCEDAAEELPIGNAWSVPTGRSQCVRASIPPPPAHSTSAQRAHAREHILRAAALKRARMGQVTTHSVVSN